MKVEVIFSPGGLAPGDAAGSDVFVVDILRATTSIVTALHHGAKAVVPVPSTEEALKLVQTLGREDVLLAGERGCLRIEGFDLGNSPREMTAAVVQGKTIVLTTTNGTRALLAVQGARSVHVFAAANFTRSADRARRVVEQGGHLLVLCAGREEAFGLDDAYAAGRLVRAAIGRRKAREFLNDAALACLDLVQRYRDRWDRPLRLSAAGRELARLGLGEDVATAALADTHPVLVTYHERRLTAVRPAP